MDSQGCADEVLEGITDLTRDWNEAHPCYNVAKNLKASHSCPKTLLEAKFKVGSIRFQAEDLSRKPNVDVTDVIASCL